MDEARFMIAHTLHRYGFQGDFMEAAYLIAARVLGPDENAYRHGMNMGMHIGNSVMDQLTNRNEWIRTQATNRIISMIRYLYYHGRNGHLSPVQWIVLYHALFVINNVV